MLPHHQFELAITAIIVAGSALLLGYWFRYTCLLILSAKTACDYAGGVAAANQLGFQEVQERLRDGSFVDFDPLRTALERDYSLITFLLKNTSQTAAEESSIETRMLEMYYGMMGVLYRAARPFSAEAARHALGQMSAVVEHLANVMGERAALAGAAA